MKQTLQYVAPIGGATQHLVCRETYVRSVELYDEDKYIEAFHTLLDYLNPEFRTKYGNADGTEFHLPHGSIVLDIHISDGRLHFGADFLNIPQKGRVAMLRQVADLNINKLLLARFVKEGDRLRMEYSCLLSESHPQKVYSIIKNICRIGDKYDDEFCSKFGATRCYEPRVTAYPAEEVDRIYDAIQSLGGAALKVIKDENERRRYGVSWNVLDTVLYQIGYFACPQGQLVNELTKAVDAMDEDLPTEELVARGKAFLEKLLAMPKDELARELYYVDKVVSDKQQPSLQNIQENFKDNILEEARKAMGAKDFERCAVRLFYKFYEVVFYCDLPDGIDSLLTAALRDASDCPVEEAANVLFTALAKIMEGDIDDEDDDLDDKDLDDDEEFDDDEQDSDSSDEENPLVQQTTQAMKSEEVQQLQQQITAAMMRGDMAEYMRLATELQQKILDGCQLNG